MFKTGRPTETVAECDLTPKQARKRFEDLKTNAKCGWCELVAEEDEEGGYMEVIESHEKVNLARTISALI
jgi:hypothetical protein